MSTLIATEVTLAQLRDRFNLVRSTDPEFFQESLVTAASTVAMLNADERIALDRVKQNYLSQLEVQSLNEATVKMVVVSPLLDIAGFYRYPFTIDSEVSIEIQDTDESGVALTGRIDTLIMREQLWILIIESKRTRFSVQTAIPQALSYLLARSANTRPGYALITNGGEFLFVKLLFAKLEGQDSPSYDLSATFSLLNRGNDLYLVLGILKQII